MISRQLYYNIDGRWDFGLDVNYVLVKIITPIIKSILSERVIYEQFIAWSLSIMDWVAGSMPSETCAEYQGLNPVWMIAMLSMTQELFLRFNDFKYLGKIDQLIPELKISIIWGQLVNHLREYVQLYALELQGILVCTLFVIGVLKSTSEHFNYEWPMLRYPSQILHIIFSTISIGRPCTRSIHG